MQLVVGAIHGRLRQCTHDMTRAHMHSLGGSVHERSSPGLAPAQQFVVQMSPQQHAVKLNVKPSPGENAVSAVQLPDAQLYLQ